MKKFVIAILYLSTTVCSTASSAKMITLKGKVVDASTSLPIYGVHVIIQELQKETVSDSGGFFSFALVEPGSYLLAFEHPAYVRYEKEFLSADTIQVRLDPVLFHAPEIVVTSTKGKIASGNQPIPTVVVDGDALPQSGTRTVSDALAEEPGVALVKDGMWETDVSIRGMSRNNVVMMVDNTRLETANDIATALSLINPFDLDRIEVIKGANSALAGTGAFGGAVNCITKSPSYSDEARVGGESLLQYESVNNSSAEYLAVESGSENFKFRGSAEYRKAGNYESPMGVVPNSQYMDFGFTGDAGARVFGDNSLDLTYQRFQAEDTGIPGGSSFSQTAAAMYTLARRDFYKIEYSIPYISSILPMLVIRASRQIIQRNVQVIQNPALTLTPHATHSTDMFQIESSIVPAKNHFLTVGMEAWQRSLDSKRERYNYSSSTVVEEAPLPNSSFGSAGIYAQDEWQLVPQSTTIILGGRYDFIRVHNDLTVDTLWIQNASGQRIQPANENILWPANTSNSASWSTNLGIHQQIIESLDASFLFSTAFRSPTLEERYQYLNNGGSVHVGNPDLQPEKSICFDAGLKWYTSIVRLNGDVYYNSLRDLVAEVLGTFEGSPAYVKTNIGQARMYGYELAVEADASSHIVLGSSISYVRGEDTKNHTNLSQIPPFNGSISANYIIDGVGTINARLEGDAQQNFLGSGDTRTAGYLLVNGGFKSTAIPFAGTFLTVDCGVQNLLNRSYMDFLSTARGEIKYEPGRNVFVTASVEL